MFTSLPLFFGLLLLGCTPVRNLPGQAAGDTLLTGAWEVVGQSLTPLRIIPHCNSIKQGAVFLFSPDTLKVYTDTSRSPCDVFRIRMANNTISIIKGDMVWLATYALQANTLTIRSDTFFSPEGSGSTEPAATQSPPTQGGVVTLEKRNYQTN